MRREACGAKRGAPGVDGKRRKLRTYGFAASRDAAILRDRSLFIDEPSWDMFMPILLPPLQVSVIAPLLYFFPAIFRMSAWQDGVHNFLSGRSDGSR